MNGDHVGGPPQDGRVGLRTYMSDAEAKSFHRTFLTSAIAFVFIAVLAHYGVWTWRSWAPPADGYRDTAPAAAVTMNTAPPATVARS